MSAGCLFHIAAAVLGLSALMLATPLVYDAVQYAGAGYLISLGLRALGARTAALDVRALERESLGHIFRQGMITNVLNPKVALFFLAFLPQFTDPARGPLAPQFLVLGVIFVANGLFVCLGYALAAAWLGEWMRARNDVSRWLNRAMGIVFHRPRVSPGVRKSPLTRMARSTSKSSRSGCADIARHLVMHGAPPRSIGDAGVEPRWQGDSTWTSSGTAWSTSSEPLW